MMDHWSAHSSISRGARKRQWGHAVWLAVSTTAARARATARDVAPVAGQGSRDVGGAPGLLRFICVATRGVVGPGVAGFGGEAGGGDLAVAERGGDDRGVHVDEVLADRGGASGGGRDAELVDHRRQRAGLQRLAGGWARRGVDSFGARPLSLPLARAIAMSSRSASGAYGGEGLVQAGPGAGGAGVPGRGVHRLG